VFCVQAADRVHRIGQRRNVRVLTIVAKNTVEYFIFSHIHKTKSEAAASVERITKQLNITKGGKTSVGQEETGQLLLFLFRAWLLTSSSATHTPPPPPAAAAAAAAVVATPSPSPSSPP
jgi:hypothetical protein